MTDMVIPPDRETLLAAIRAVLDAVRYRDYNGHVNAHEAVDVIADAVLALLPTEADTKALVETATRLGRELGRREAAEELAAEADRIAEGYAESARAQRALSIEKGFARGESNMRTAIAFRNKADGAWAVAHIAREIATKEPK